MTQKMIPYDGNKNIVKVDSSHSFNSFYVAATRGKNDIRIYTDDKDVLRESVKRVINKSSALDYSEKNVVNVKSLLPNKSEINAVKTGNNLQPGLRSETGKNLQPVLKLLTRY